MSHMSPAATMGRRPMPRPLTGGSDRRTRLLLACGAVAGPLFMVVSLVQAFTRPGFDLNRQAISMLSLGDLGWIQIANFLITGGLALALALGVRRALHPGRAGTWGALLLGAYGVGLIAAGVFHPDPAYGFPPGAPAGMPATMSMHALVHNVAFFVAFIGLIAACLVFARRAAGLGRRPWALYCVATGLAAPVFIALATAGVVASGVALAALGLVTSGWIVAVSVHLLWEQHSR